MAAVGLDARRYADRVVGDTTAAASRAQQRVWRSLEPRERVEIAAAMSDDAYRLAMDAVARRHPDLDHPQLVREFVMHVHGIDIGAPSPS